MLGQTKFIVGLWSDQSSRIDAGMRFFFLFFFKTLLYLMNYFNTVLKRPSMKLAGTSMPFCKWRLFWKSVNIWCGAVIFLERGKLEQIKYIAPAGQNRRARWPETNNVFVFSLELVLIIYNLKYDYLYLIELFAKVCFKSSSNISPLRLHLQGRSMPCKTGEGATK